MSTNYWKSFVERHLAGESELQLRLPLVAKSRNVQDFLQSIPFNGPLNISSYVHYEGAPPTPGGGVFLGFQKTGIDPRNWNTVYGTLVFDGRKDALVCKSWPVPYTGYRRSQIEGIEDGIEIDYKDIFLIREWALSNQVIVRYQVGKIIKRHEGNKRAEGRINRAHLNELRRASNMAPL